MEGNPFQQSLDTALTVEPCVVVIFGASGDLTHRKLVPALYNLSVDRLLPAKFALVGFARREYSHDQFREILKDSVSKHSRRVPLDNSVWQDFAAHTFYHASNFDDSAGYVRLAELLNKLDSDFGVPFNRIFYLATNPEYFQVIAQQLHQVGLLDQVEIGASSASSQEVVQKHRKSRVIVEKPFGRDLQSAKELNHALLRCMKENQIFRIDHYLGKETVQNLLVFRFANGIFEPIWNHKYIDHVEISVCESLGVGGRAGYFDQAGILRDIVQNHALQLLCLVALEPPVAFEADAVRDEKVKVLRSVRRLNNEEVFRQVVRGRYLAGAILGEQVTGYLGEQGVDSQSSTETYVAMELAIDNWRWAGVPFYLRSGKRLPKRITEISVHFRSAPHRLFQDEEVDFMRPNILSFQIQPDEGISMKISSKPPGPKVQVHTVNMEFSYGTSFGVEPPEAYERLLLDCMRGDATLFTRNDEIEQAWDLLAPIFQAWDPGQGRVPPVFGYEAGTWGPQAADELLHQRLSRGWRRL